jgi:exosome complex component RRP42
MRAGILVNEIQDAIALAREGKRVDGRALDEYREITVSKDMCENAESSTMVTLGKTKVLAGLKLGVGTPYPDSPAQGAIAVGAEALPLAHAEYESGRPSADEVELARVVDRGLRESKAIDFSQLCIKAEEAVWVGYLDFYALNGDGNLFDAGSIASLITFRNGKLPKLDKNNKIIYGEYNGKLKMTKQPLLTTFVKVAGKIMLDPSFIEEKAAEARYSVATTEDGNLTAMQKGVGGSFTLEEVNYMIDKAFVVSEKIRKQIKNE